METSQITVEQPVQQDVSLSFKTAMRQYTSTVSIIAADSDAKLSGMLATAVIPVSMNPPVLLISVNKNASVHPPICSS